MNPNSETKPQQTTQTEMPTDPTTSASGARTTETARCPRPITKEVGSLGTTTEGFVRATPIVTARLRVGKNGLGDILLVPVGGSGLVRPGLVLISLFEGMGSRMKKLRMPKRRSMMGFSRGFSTWFSYQGI